ncbi:hypothetical protein [Burkholderia gladioli]|uniref:hypothetical protein n=1 Tax=Burkholderia gladioli TaxID=28095 RepID=UPI0016404E43|nr:hypothetical protein [Burkholderia gladioli]
MNPITGIRRAIERSRCKRWRRRVERMSPDMPAARLNQRLRYDVYMAYRRLTDVRDERVYHWCRRPVATAGQPVWQAAFNRFCLSDTRIEEWAPLLDRYLAAGATGAIRDQALVEAAARTVIDGQRGYRGGVVHGDTLADGTFIYPGETTNFVRLALADPTMRQRVLNFALRNLYMNPELVQALLAEGAEPGLHQVKHAAQDAVDAPTILVSLDLLLSAGGDVDHIEDEHWFLLPDRLKAKHGSIVSRDRAIVAPDGSPSDRHSLELGHCYGHSLSPEALAAIEEAKRRAVPGRITADMLNGPWPWIPSPDNLSAPVPDVPKWVHMLFRMPASARPAEVGRLAARGADVTRAGIARHTSHDPQGLVQACFDQLPEVRIHVEGMELRQAIAEVDAVETPPAPPARRRL